MSLDATIARGRARLEADPALVADIVGRARADDIAVLLHSSGTTGTPKGVPLRHRNIIAGVTNAVGRRLLPAECEDHYAYLPMAWVGDLVFTVGAGTLLRFTMNIPERQETVLRDLREVAPTMLSGGAARLGQYAHAHPGRHGRFDAAQAQAV